MRQFRINFDSGNYLGARDIPRTWVSGDLVGKTKAASGARPKMNSDEQLVLEFQQGSQEAFVELFERYREPVYGFFRGASRIPAREELAQECFLALLQNVKRYEPRASFRSYLYGIAIHLVSAERRKAGREVAENEKLDDRALEENARRAATRVSGCVRRSNIWEQMSARF